MQSRPGHLIIGLSGATLSSEESTFLTHPAVAGVILFQRNYQDKAQLTALADAIHSLRADLVIGVDQEGGRVQRFKKEFSPLPAAHEAGILYDQSPVAARAQAYETGLKMATELKHCGIDLSFAPVADRYSENSRVIGDRAFHTDPTVVAILAQAYFQGMHAAGVMAVAKHFPGHGSVAGDTHETVVKDTRAWPQLEQDLVPFQSLITAGIPAVMAAHVIYPEVDSKPAGFSAIWLQTILRARLGFQGLIFSDDLGMQAAKAHGSPKALIQEAIQAGCDRVLLCNELSVIAKILA